MTTFCFVVILSEAKDLSWLNDIGSVTDVSGFYGGSWAAATGIVHCSGGACAAMAEQLRGNIE